VGDLRFKAPQKPQGTSDKINRGDVGAICPQASPAWEKIATDFVQNYLIGFPFNYTKAADKLPKDPPTTRDPRTSEDCLFLDVQVPKSVWDTNDASAPVLVWIYGGGYTGGEKTGGGSYNSAGLLARASEPFVTVTMNYRLGAFGWMSGSDFQGEGGEGNAGLADQLMALEWVQDNIHLFGGDKSRVTVMGESAGGGSIMHHITGNGGKGSIPFQKAIPQSPAFFPVADKDQQNDSWKTFLDALGVDSLDAAQKASSDDVIRANEVAVWGAQYGTFTFGPQPDGKYVPDLPGKLLLEGKFHKDLKLMTTHTSKEGLIFTSPELQSTTELRSELKSFFHGISDDVIDYLANDLYPVDDYKSQFERAVQVVEDSAFICNTNYLNTGFNNTTYSCKLRPHFPT
jgi:carboxylesterase type B